MLLDIATYRKYTQTAPTSDQQTALADIIPTIESDLAEFLAIPDGRLDQATYTERLRIYYDPMATGLFGPSGWVYPSHVPVASVSNMTVDIASDGLTVRNVSPDSDPVGLFGSPVGLDRFATLVYVGGWTLATAPGKLLRAIATMAQMRLQGSPVPVVAGASSVRSGDVSVTYAAGQDGTLLVPLGIQQSLRGLRTRRV